MNYGLLILLALLAIIAFAIKASKPSKKNKKYVATGCLLTPAELKFYKTLITSIRENEVIFAKVRQADIIKPDCKKSDSNYWQHFNLIAKRHVDFVICNETTSQPLAVIELNDKSHNEKSRQTRDEDLRAALKQAEIKLVEIKASNFYSVNELQMAIYGNVFHGVEEPQANRPAKIHAQPACVKPLPKSDDKYAHDDKGTSEQPRTEEPMSKPNHPHARWMRPEK